MGFIGFGKTPPDWEIDPEQELIGARRKTRFRIHPIRLRTVRQKPRRRQDDNFSQVDGSTLQWDPWSEEPIWGAGVDRWP